MKASELFVKCLENEGVEYIFGIPGEENLDVMDALLDSKIEFITTRHEQGAAFMADVYGRLTGRAGVCLATLGPGATNLVTGFADADMDRAPIVAIAGQGATTRMHKEHASRPHGFFILTDFGDQLLLDQLSANTADHLYGLAINTLCQLQTVPTEHLPRYDSALLQQEMTLFSTWFLGRHKHIPMDHEMELMLAHTFALLEQNALQQPQTFVHRDYHARNLMLLNNDRLGVIDFQDAVLGPVSYDLVSLLRDCYIDWPAAKIEQWLRCFIDQQHSQYQYREFKRWFDLMGVQRHLKAVGIFCRLHYRDGKANYLNDIPRTLEYLSAVSSEYQELQAFNRFLKTVL